MWSQAMSSACSSVHPNPPSLPGPPRASQSSSGEPGSSTSNDARPGLSSTPAPHVADARSCSSHTAHIPSRQPEPLESAARPLPPRPENRGWIIVKRCPRPGTSSPARATTSPPARKATGPTTSSSRTPPPEARLARRVSMILRDYCDDRGLNPRQADAAIGISDKAIRNLLDGTVWPHMAIIARPRTQARHPAVGRPTQRRPRHETRTSTSATTSKPGIGPGGPSSKAHHLKPNSRRKSAHRS